MTDSSAPPAHGHGVFLTLDGIRFVAALLVVTRHVPFFGPLVFPTSYLAVDLFFLLSGFVIANAYGRRLRTDLSPGGFLRIRITRLYPLYALGIALGVIAALASHGTTPVKLAYHLVGSLLVLPNPNKSLALFPLNGPSWSLFLELVSNVVYVAGIGWLVGARLVATVCAAALGLAVCAVGWGSLDYGYDVPTLPVGIARIAFSFSAGLLLHHLYRRVTAARPPRPGNAWPWLLVGFVAVLFALHWPSAYAPACDLAAVVLLFPCIVLAGALHQPVGRTAGLMRLLGRSSYAIYVVHMPLGVIVRVASQKLLGLDPVDHGPWAGLAFAAALVALCLALDTCYDAPLRRKLGPALARLQARGGAPQLFSRYPVRKM